MFTCITFNLKNCQFIKKCSSKAFLFHKNDEKQNILLLLCWKEIFIIVLNIKIASPDDIISQEVTSLWKNNSININTIWILHDLKLTSFIENEWLSNLRQAIIFIKLFSFSRLVYPEQHMLKTWLLSSFISWERRDYNDTVKSSSIRSSLILFLCRYQYICGVWT